MEFVVSFLHLESQEALRRYAERKIKGRVTKYVTKPILTRVTLSHDAEGFLAKCNIKAGDDFDFFAQESGQIDLYAAIDLLAHRLDNMLRRHKEKLKNHKFRNLPSIETVPLAKASGSDWEPAIDASEILRYESSRQLHS